MVASQSPAEIFSLHDITAALPEGRGNTSTRRRLPSWHSDALLPATWPDVPALAAPRPARPASWSRPAPSPRIDRSQADPSQVDPSAAPAVSLPAILLRR